MYEYRYLVKVPLRVSVPHGAQRRRHGEVNHRLRTTSKNECVLVGLWQCHLTHVWVDEARTVLPILRWTVQSVMHLEAILRVLSQGIELLSQQDVTLGLI